MKSSGFLREYYQQNGKLLGTGLLVVIVFWVGVLIILPQLSMLDYSLREYLPSGEVGDYTLQNYKHLIYGAEGASDAYNYVDLNVFKRTIIAAICVTIFNLILCYPIAYYLGQSATGLNLRMLAILLIIPYWINEILRAFALKIIFGATGLINTALVGLGVFDVPFDFIRNDIALYAGLGYAYILLMVFPMYNVIESLDHNQIEAARDLGAPWWRIHKRIVIPYAKPGISSGATMVFMLSAGALAAPQILGGPSSLWFTQIIYQWFNDGGNWSQGAAYAIVLLVSCIIIVLAFMRLFKVNMGDIGK